MRRIDMEVNIEVGPEFKRQFKRLAKKYHSLRNDLATWKKEILEDPFQGDSLGGGVRKVRMPLLIRGKAKVEEQES